MQSVPRRARLLRKTQIDTMQGTVAELSAKIEAIQNGEAAVFAPNGEGELFPKEFAKADKDE